MLTAQKAVIYARYSSSRQREESIEDQLRICNSFAQREGYEVIGHYCDYAMSGTTDARPEFQRMIADASWRGFGAVIVYALDRFARDRYDSAIYKNKLKQCGARVISATEGIPDTAEGIILESVVEGMAELYSKKLSQNVKRGLMGNAEKCKANGVHIFGYRINADGYYEPDPVTGPLVKKVFEKYVEGESQANIAAWLNSLDVKTMRGRPWTNNKISWVIRNDKYYGLYHFSDYYQKDGMPALVTEELWAKANGRNVRKKSMTAELLLSGRAYCECGQRMVGDSGTSRNGTLYHYYACPAKLKGSCDAQRVSEKQLDEFVIDRTEELLNNDETLDEICSAMDGFVTEGTDNKMYVGLRNKRNDLSRRLNNVKETLELGGHDEELRDRMMELRRELSVVEEELNSLDEIERLDHKEVFQFWLKWIREKSWESEERARKMVDALVSRVIVGQDTIAIEYNYHDHSDKLATQQYSVRSLSKWSG